GRERQPDALDLAFRHATDVSERDGEQRRARDDRDPALAQRREPGRCRGADDERERGDVCDEEVAVRASARDARGVRVSGDAPTVDPPELCGGEPEEHRSRTEYSEHEWPYTPPPRADRNGNDREEDESVGQERGDPEQHAAGDGED